MRTVNKVLAPSPLELEKEVGAVGLAASLATFVPERTSGTFGLGVGELTTEARREAGQQLTPAADKRWLTAEAEAAATRG